MNYAFFASCGNALGTNIERDLHRRCRNLYGCRLRPFFINLTLSGEDDSDTYESTKIATLAPYEVFSSMHTLNPDAFDHCVLGDRPNPAECCREIWDVLSESTPHHVNTDPTLACVKDRVVPLCFHADGGEAVSSALMLTRTIGNHRMHCMHRHHLLPLTL